MLKVLSCMGGEHDPWLVALAALFCLTASFTAFRLHGHARQAERSGKVVWALLTGLAAGSGIWSTHFTAMLAYQPKLPVGFEPVGTLMSLLVAIVATSISFLLAAQRARPKVAPGVIFAAGIAAMHYGGMHAFRPQGRLVWDPWLVGASVLVALWLSIAAIGVSQGGRTIKRQLAGAAVLTLAICALHFTGMAAVTILPDPTVVRPEMLLARGQMLIAVSALTGFVLVGALALAAVDLQARRTSLERMRLLFDSNPVPMWLIEPGSFQFLAVNDAAVRAYGYTREQFLGLTVSDIVHVEEHPRLASVLQAGVSSYNGEHLWRHVRADGVVRVVQPFAQTIRQDGGAAILTALFDVTDRENATKALAAAKEAAEAANRAKSDFLANMSHEIRTPLNGVVGVVSALSRTELDARQREMLSIVDGSTSVLARVLSDILDVSLMEAGELTLREEPFDLAAVVSRVADLHRAGAEAKGLRYRVSIESGAPSWVIGDSDRLAQILGNLLNNAVKFTTAGDVCLNVSLLSDGRLRFEVSDTGIGFDAEAQGRLFRRFEQADGSIRRRFGGSGLGLSIAHKIAERMGGALVASSTPGHGATFVLEAPLTPCAAPDGDTAVAPKAIEGVAPFAPKVLLADDHAVNRRVVELVLGTVDAQVCSVENGAEAVEAFERQGFDVVLMDLQMPVMDGLEAIRRIRSLEARSRRPATPIIVLSASALSEHIEASTLAGATGHLSKPIQASALLDAVYAALGEDLSGELPMRASA